MSDPNKKCPFCGSTETQKQSDFGTSLMAMQYFCLACKSPFEWIKWGEPDSRLDLPEFLKDSDHEA